jgi:hypothetical protein
MNDQKKKAVTTWIKIRNWIVKITAVLVVLPSLMNAGMDIYNTLLNIPRTQSEQINSDLFKEHFNKPPVVAVPVPIKTNMGTINMRLSVYEDGDVFAEYGNYSQWFPFPEQETASLSLISTVYAFTPSPVLKDKNYIQQDVFKDSVIKRERYYPDGTKESYKVNTNTGKIHDMKTTQGMQPPEGATPAVKIIPFPTIDIEDLKRGKRIPD